MGDKMKTIETEFTDHDQANNWAETQNLVVIMSSRSKAGYIILTVTERE